MTSQTSTKNFLEANLLQLKKIEKVRLSSLMYLLKLFTCKKN